MASFRNYTETPGITEDYRRVRAFLVRRGVCEFTYARWDWMATHGYLDKGALGRVGLWEEEGRIVGLATFDTTPGDSFLIAAKGREGLRAEMLRYARESLAKDGECRIVAPDGDAAFQDLLAGSGFRATERKEYDAAFFPAKTPMEYALPEGFSVTDMAERYDPEEYLRVLWKGFDHEQNGEGAFAFSDRDRREVDWEMLREHVDLRLKVAVIAPDGHFASYCGMWYDKEAGFSLVEPVATDPAYRRMGLGRAAVLEGVRRTAALGSPLALVGSMQAFYYRIGLRPFATHTVWSDR